MYNHSIIDMYFDDIKSLQNINEWKNILIDICIDCDVNILNTFFHEFTSTKGFTGVICLTESHISIHTWPEKLFLCIDVFMCDNEKSQQYIDLLLSKIECKSYNIKIINRGT